MADHKAELLAAARQAREKAYAPYSLFPVGAAVLGSGGGIYSGCNVENASLGLTCCAERNAIFAMVAAGERIIKEILVIGGTAEVLPPCGACRQVIAEFAEPTVVVHMCDRSGAGRSTTVAELVPFLFRLKKRAPARARGRKRPVGK
ncbi:MAG: cytidine deaminase [Candidatus Aminicenantes bacterium]|nr:cytidine deaminase [Candidatus Aminicenantes bacterium]